MNSLNTKLIHSEPKQRTELYLFESFDSEKSKLVGHVVSLPQAPPWMCNHFEAIEAASASSGTAALTIFGEEWFERIIAVGEDKNTWLLEGGLLDKMTRVLAPPFADGCGQGSELTDVYLIKEVDEELKLTPLEGSPFHAVLSDWEGEPKSGLKAKRIDLYPVEGDYRDPKKLDASLAKFHLVVMKRKLPQPAAHPARAKRARHLAAMCRKYCSNPSQQAQQKATP